MMNGKQNGKQHGQRSTMQVDALMTTHVCSCEPHSTLNEVAQIMWEYDCGVVPVLDSSADRHVVGMVTDRDIAMAAYLQGKSLHEIRARDVMSTELTTCKPSDSVEAAGHCMVQGKVRRLPVVDDEGRLLGLLSLAHLAREAGQGHGGSRQQLAARVGETLSRICESRPAAEAVS